jgi:hypothetical protein
MEPLTRPVVPSDDIRGKINGVEIVDGSPEELAKCLH